MCQPSPPTLPRFRLPRPMRLYKRNDDIYVRYITKLGLYICVRACARARARVCVCALVVYVDYVPKQSSKRKKLECWEE